MIAFHFIFLFFQSSKSITYELGENYGGTNIKPQAVDGVILIQQTIYQSFHNIKGEIGGCIYIHNNQVETNFNSVGFSDCFTTKEGGAINILSNTIKISNTCAYLCESTDNSYQFAKLESNDEHENNRISLLTIVSCCSNNKGKSAIGLCGATKYYTTDLNSSNNYNDCGSSSYGACFRTHGILYHQTIGVNFLNSQGYDVFNTDFAESATSTSAFENGNVYNCSTKYIFKFKGRTKITNFRFGRLNYTQGAFMSGSGNKTAYSLTFANSLIDVQPTKGIDTNVNIAGGCSLQNPVQLLSINNIGLDYCPVPSMKFTKSIEFSPSKEFTKTAEFSPSKKFVKPIEISPSKKFTKTAEFSPSKKFTKTAEFSPSKKFTKTTEFSPSKEFTKTAEFSPSKEFTKTAEFSPSKEFTKTAEFSGLALPSASRQGPTSAFTASDAFTPSFTFSPEATKYPDGLNGYNKAKIDGGRKMDQKATAAQIGATSGISVALIIAAVVLMLAYLRSKRKQLKGALDELSDTFLHDTDDSSCSYSYSYYTYEYYSRTVRDESSYSDYGYSYGSYNEFTESFFSQVE